MVKSKRYNWKFWAGILLAQFLLFYFFSRSSFMVDVFYNFFEFQKDFHLKLFSWIGFSFGDLLYVFLIFYVIYLLIKIYTSREKKRFILTLFILINLFYFIYQIFWGMLYFQPPLIKKLPEKEPTIEEIKTLAEKYLAFSITERSKVQTDKNGVFVIHNLNDTENEIINLQKQIPTTINIKKNSVTNSIKPSLFSIGMNYSGILGYYNPFTAEAQYNKNLPSTYLPITMAHESAHQIGYAREQEANFIGYLIGNASENPEIRYSTYYFTLKQLLNALWEQEPVFVQEILNRYSAGMKKDREFEHQFMEQHQSILDRILGVTNDAFLKFNQQEGSVTYSYFVDLLVRYERTKP